MEIFKIVILGIAAAVLAVLLKGQRPELALLLSLAAGGLLLMLCLGNLSDLIGSIGRLAENYGVGSEYLSTALKVTGIACVADLGVQLCRDAGENAIAAKVELAGRVVMVLLAVPVMEELLKLVSSLLA